MDGTLVESWASLKSFRPKDGPPPPAPKERNDEVDYKGRKRKNDTHVSTTEPQATLGPVYPSREDRIKGHIAVCFPAFRLQVAFLRIVREEAKLKILSARAMLQELCEVRMVHLQAGETEYRIRTERSLVANAIFRAAQVPVPRRVNTIH